MDHTEVGAGGWLVGRVHHEHLGGDADQPLGVADLGQGLGDGGGGPEHDDLRRHQRAGGAFVVGEQAAHHVGVLVVHRLEDRRALLARHLGEQVGRVVVLHLLEHPEQALEIEALDDAQLLGFGQLFEQVGEALVVHHGGELLALGERQGAHDGGHIARVHVAHARRLGGDLVAGCAAEEPGHLGVVEQAVARSPAQRRAAGEADLAHLPPRLAAVAARAEGDIAHGLVAHPAVDQVATDEQLTAAHLERVEVDVPAAQAGTLAVERPDAADVDEDPPALAEGDEAEHSRGGALLGRHDDDVLEPADGRSAGVEQWQAHHPERVDEIAGHGARLPLHAGAVRPDSDRFDGHQGVAVGHASTPVGEGGAGERVGARRIAVVALPPAPGDGDHTGAQPRGDLHR